MIEKKKLKFRFHGSNAKQKLKKLRKERLTDCGTALPRLGPAINSGTHFFAFYF